MDGSGQPERLAVSNRCCRYCLIVWRILKSSFSCMKFLKNFKYWSWVFWGQILWLSSYSAFLYILSSDIYIYTYCYHTTTFSRPSLHCRVIVEGLFHLYFTYAMMPWNGCNILRPLIYINIMIVKIYILLFFLFSGKFLYVQFHHWYVTQFTSSTIETFNVTFKTPPPSPHEKWFYEN